MSLVDASYGSDDEDDVVEVKASENEEERGNGAELPASSIPAKVRSEDSVDSRATALSVYPPSPSPTIGMQLPQGVVFPSGVESPRDLSSRTILPDVSELLGPSSSDLKAPSDTLKKRRAGTSAVNILPRSKVPRGNLVSTRSAPDTVGGLLTPPQLRGRSNVATEDLDKIFSRKQRR